MIKEGDIFPPLETPDLSEIKNPPETEEGVAGQEILVGANKKSQGMARDTQGVGEPPQAGLTEKLEGFELVLGILGEN